MAKHPTLKADEAKGQSDANPTVEVPSELPSQETVPSDGAVATTDASSPDEPVRLDVGARQRRAFMPKMLTPDRDWINKNVVAPGKGTRATLGRIQGVATDWKDKENSWADKVINSIVLTGIFEGEDYITGEVSQFTSVYLPLAYAERVKIAFEADKSLRAVQIDVDIGIEATGKTIPYEWVVTAFLEGKEMALLRKMRASRARPASVLQSAKGEPLQLTGPAK